MGRKRTQMDVTLKFLLDNGDILPGAGVLQVSTRDQTRYADLGSDGIIFFEGNRHRSLSSFAVAAIRSCGATGRKTANGWQVVSYHGRPLEQYRAEFLERQSHGSDSSRDVDQINTNGVGGCSNRIARKKRRALYGKNNEEIVAEALAKSVEWREGPSELAENLQSSDSGVSLASSVDTAVCRRPPWTKTFMQKRARPSRTWFDALRSEMPEQRSVVLGREIMGSGVKPTNYVRCIDGACGLKLEKAMSVKGTAAARGREDDADQTLVVNMWLKKALSKRHREECGMTS